MIGAESVSSLAENCELNTLARAFRDYSSSVGELLESRSEADADRVAHASNIVLQELYAAAQVDKDRIAFNRKNIATYCGYSQLAISLLQSKTPSANKERYCAAQIASNSVLASWFCVGGVEAYEKQQVIGEAALKRVRGVLPYE